jgi:hypothetical protein
MFNKSGGPRGRRRDTTESRRISFSDWPADDEGGGGLDDHDDHDDYSEDSDRVTELDAPPPFLTTTVKYHHGNSNNGIKKKRSASLGSEKTAASSSYPSLSSSSSSSQGGGGNVWTRLLGGRDANWDKLDGCGGDVWEDNQDHDDQDDGRGAAKTFALTAWYEIRHFVETVISNPVILLTSLATFGILCGIGMAAINAESDAHVQKQKATAEFVVR